MRSLTRFSFVAISFAFVPTVTLGQTCNGFCNPLQSNTLSGFLQAILSSLIFILFPVIVMMLVYSGFLFIAAQGNPEKLRTARRVFLWTLIGGFVILASWAIAQAIQATVNAL